MWPVIEKGNPFVRGNVQEAIAFHLEAVTAGQGHEAPLQCAAGFDEVAARQRVLAGVEWGPKNRPDLRYMSWSYSPDLTLEHNELCRKLIKSEIYQRFWGDRFTLDDSSDAKGFYRTTRPAGADRHRSKAPQPGFGLTG